MKKTAIVIMLITIVSKIIGFVREMALSYYFGTTIISDAYLISLTIPMVVFSFIGTSIATSYIPMYSEIKKNKGKIKALDYTNNLINIMFIISTLIIIITLLFTDTIVKIFASGFIGEELRMAIKFTQISIWGVYLTGIIYILSGFLQVEKKYIIPALIGLPMNFVTIIFIYIGSKYKIWYLSIGNLLALLSQVILLRIFSAQKGYKYNFVIDFKDKYIKRMVQIAIPLIVGVSIYQINTLIDRTMASRIVVGGISALNYSNKISGFIQGIFVTSISTVMYPLISNMASENNNTGLKEVVVEAINIISLFVIPSVIGIMIFSEPIVILLFGRGVIDASGIEMTHSTLFYYSIGIIGFGYKEVLSKVFYSIQDTKTPMINATISLLINIILNIILSQFMGLKGLAFATSISTLFSTFLLFISLRKKIGSFGIREVSISFIKILFAALIMGMIAKISFNHLATSLSQNISLLISIGIGALSYFVIIYFMKIEDVDVIVNAVKKKVVR